MQKSNFVQLKYIISFIFWLWHQLATVRLHKLHKNIIFGPKSRVFFPFFCKNRHKVAQNQAILKENVNFETTGLSGFEKWLHFRIWKKNGISLKKVSMEYSLIFAQCVPPHLTGWKWAENSLMDVYCRINFWQFYAMKIGLF